MATHRFTQSITVAGVPYNAGDEVDSAVIPRGNFDSLTRLGQLEPITAPTVDPPVVEPNIEAVKPDVGDDPDAPAPAQTQPKPTAPTTTKKK